MLEQQPDEVRAGPLPGLAEDHLLARVMVRGEFEERAVGDGPAGEGPRGLLHVALGIVADAEGEQLHQLTGEILVRVPVAIGRGVEPDQQGRVPHCGVQEARRTGPERIGGTGRSAAAWRPGR